MDEPQQHRDDSLNQIVTLIILGRITARLCKRSVIVTNDALDHAEIRQIRIDETDYVMSRVTGLLDRLTDEMRKMQKDSAEPEVHQGLNS